MKKLIILFVFLTSYFSYSQQNNYITNKDFIVNKSDMNQIIVDKIIKCENGENEFVNTKLFIGKEKSSKSNADFYNSVIYKTLLAAKFTLKNKSTFKPISLMIFEENSSWKVHINFSGMNNIGGKKDGSMGLLFDQNLEYRKTFSSID